MKEFDLKASGWDNNPMHLDRSKAIANEIIKSIPLNRDMTVLEYGAGTGITAFLLKDYLKEIILMDSSVEMVRIMNEKIKAANVANLNAINFDLENTDYTGKNIDLIYTQMVLHHVTNIGNILRKFHNMLNPGGYLAVADLFTEDGSFHGNDFTGHKGFDPEELSDIARSQGFIKINHHKCFVINKVISETSTKQFDVFLLTANSQPFIKQGGN